MVSLSLFSPSPIIKIKNPVSHSIKSCMATNPPAVQVSTSFGFKSLMETFTIDVHKAEGRPLNVPLISPFTIASTRLDKVENVAIRVELNNGCVGWGETPILPCVTTEDQPLALEKAAEACQFLRRSRGKTLGQVLSEINQIILPGHSFASVRAGVEMALIDAVANSIGLPLWKLFGGFSNEITTDITIPIVSPSEAAALASKYNIQGFKILKLKVGKNLTSDIQVLQAIRAVHPDCLFILDANEGYTSEEAIQVLEKLHEMEVTPILFEQPVHRDDWEGLGYVSEIARNKYRVSVAADESCRSLEDVKKIAEENLADVINIKLAKVGVLGALEIIDLARASGLDLMIGGMVETRLAMGFAGNLAAGLGCFKFIDLDTPILLAEDPVLEGYKASGPVYKFSNARGHGGFLHWDHTLWSIMEPMDIVGKIKEDASLPKATMTKIIKEMLPPDVRVARDAQDLLIECCVEFINLISSESNEVCYRGDKRTIAPEHVLKALEVLGFGDYIEEVYAAYEQHRLETMDTTRSGKLSNGAEMTEEEALVEQQRMFAEARARMNGGAVVPKQSDCETRPSLSS